MTFKEYLAQDGRNIAQIAVDAGVSLPTVYRAMAGMPVAYSSAKALSRATKGVIPIVQLCEGDQADGTV
jgi:hypothetical protein